MKEEKKMKRITALVLAAMALLSSCGVTGPSGDAPENPWGGDNGRAFSGSHAECCTRAFAGTNTEPGAHAVST